jgi:hypothetical protein
MKLDDATVSVHLLSPLRMHRVPHDLLLAGHGIYNVIALSNKCHMN